VEGGNAFGLVFHIGLLTRCHLTADWPETAFRSVIFLPEIMALVVAVVAVVGAAAAV
jgi:hypothetical protein